MKEEFATRAPDPPLRARIGMAAGEPVDHDNDIYGAAVNRASRICNAAVPGHVLVSAVVHDLGEEQGFVFGEQMSVDLKGFSESAAVYELLDQTVTGRPGRRRLTRSKRPSEPRA